MGDLTLDIAEVQILVHYPHDPTFQWHHRVLLHRVEGGTWIALTPDHELQTHNLANTPHRILDRRAPFPPELAADVYAHDPLGKAQLLSFKRQAKIQAVIRVRASWMIQKQWRGWFPNLRTQISGVPSTWGF